jgi:hypothetical protein
MKERSKRRRSRRSANGGSSLFDLLVPAGLFAATDFMKKRSNKYVRSRSYLTQNSNRKSRKRRY